MIKSGGGNLKGKRVVNWVKSKYQSMGLEFSRSSLNWGADIKSEIVSQC